jgi:hypothetical protein
MKKRKRKRDQPWINGHRSVWITRAALPTTSTP